jgi:hypothetical protein
VQVRVSVPGRGCEAALEGQVAARPFADLDPGRALAALALYYDEAERVLAFASLAAFTVLTGVLNARPPVPTAAET